MKVVAAIVAILIVVGGGIYAIARHNDNHKTSTSPQTTSTSPTQHSQSSNSSANTSSNNAASSSLSSTNSIAISNFAFSPADITVKKGTTVTWTNRDSTAHTVTETDGKDGPKSADLNQGQTYSFTFNTVGSFKYRCSIHTYMTGSVTVTD